MESFGPEPDGTAFLALLNDTVSKQDGMVTPDLKALSLEQTASAPKLVSGNVATPSDLGWQISLRPQRAEVPCLGWQSDNEPNPEGCQPVAGGRQARRGPVPNTHLSN